VVCFKEGRGILRERVSLLEREGAVSLTAGGCRRPEFSHEEMKWAGIVIKVS